MLERFSHESTLPEETPPSHEILGTYPVVLLSGAIASGKETGSNFIEETYGFSHLTVSDILKEEALKRGMKPPFFREDLRRIALEFAEEGPSVFIQRLAEQMDTSFTSSKYQGAIIDGLRIPDVVSELMGRQNVVGIWIEADQAVRKDRFIVRGATPEQIAEFDETDKIENEAMASIKDMYQYTVTNNGSPEELYTNLAVIMEYNFGISPLDSQGVTIYP